MPSLRPRRRVTMDHLPRVAGGPGNRSGGVKKGRGLSRTPTTTAPVRSFQVPKLNGVRPAPAEIDLHTWQSNICGQAERPISTGKLRPLQVVHLRPINLVVFEGPSGTPYLGGGFPLRCLQRLSV